VDMDGAESGETLREDGLVEVSKRVVLEEEKSVVGVKERDSFRVAERKSVSGGGFEGVYVRLDVHYTAALEQRQCACFVREVWPFVVPVRRLGKFPDCALDAWNRYRNVLNMVLVLAKLVIQGARGLESLCRFGEIRTHVRQP